MREKISEIEYKENFFKILSKETVSIEEKYYDMYLEESNIYSAVVYRDKKSDTKVKKFISTTKNEARRINDNYLLPIGSVVVLSNEKVMIIARAMKEENSLYDYTAVQYPLGLIGNEIIKFNSEEISEILYFGYESEENSSLTIDIKSFLDSNR